MKLSKNCLMNSLYARARWFLGLGLVFGFWGCEAPGLALGPVNSGPAKEQRQPESPKHERGATEDGDEPEVLIALTCEQDASCPSDRLAAWQVWTSRPVFTGSTGLNLRLQSTYFGQSEISVGRGASYSLDRIESVFVDANTMTAYLRVSGLPDKLMPLRQAVMQGQSVWQLANYSAANEVTLEWWLTLRNSRWLSPTVAAMDLCLNASLVDCETLEIEVGEGFEI